MVWILLAAGPVFSQILPSGLGSRWWRAPQMVEKLGLTPEQQKKMDDVFQQNRARLIDLTASLDKEEAALDPLVSAEQPDADKIRAQIGRVAAARAELEKTNADMLLGLRLLLTLEQWRRLQEEAKPHPPRPRKLARDESSPAAPKPKPR
jgi:Spy/CpxP family protein refolding chaperone